MNAKYKQLEDALLNATDLLIEKTKSQGEKALYNLFKSAILKKYRDQYDVDIQQGEVEKDTVDKSIDFLFENACVSFRTLPNLKDSDKEDVINPNRSLGPISSGDVKVLSCSPESKECLPLIYGSHKT